MNKCFLNIEISWINSLSLFFEKILLIPRDKLYRDKSDLGDPLNC